MNEMVCIWVLDTLLFSLEHIHINWLRDHTSWAHVELEWRLRLFSSTSNLWFWISPQQGTLSLFLYFEIYIVHVIYCECFSLRMFCMRYKHVFFQHNYQCIFMGLNSILEVFSHKANAFIFLCLFLGAGSPILC